MKGEGTFYGFVPSQLDGSERVVDVQEADTLEMPARYTYLDVMSPVLDQGSDSTCVPHSISACYDYYNAVKHPETNGGQFVNADFAIYQIYDSRTNKGPGMTYKEALGYCKSTGVTGKDAYDRKDFAKCSRISDFALVKNELSLKYSILANGPCPIATMVRDPNSKEFWKGRGLYGGHATCLIGYDDARKAFLLRNSWGVQWGDGGYTWFPYSDINGYLIEAWTVIM